MTAFNPVNLVWLRRDLRLHDHTALARALVDGTVQPVFVFDTDILKRFDNTDDRRLSFIAATLCHLHEQLSKQGGGLLVLHGSAVEVMPKLARAVSARQIIAAEDYEPATRQRDASVAAHAPLELVRDHLIFAPDELLREGQPYKIFTPYFRAWTAKLEHYPATIGECAVHDKGSYADWQALAKLARGAQLSVLDAGEGPQKLLEQVGYRYHEDGEWRVDDAHMRLDSFTQRRLNAYPTARDFVARAGTSRLSPYLRFGLLSVRECARAAKGVGSAKWLAELAWRDFYAMILYHFPESVTQEWNPKFRKIKWSHNKAQFAAWKEGRTGYPIIDAAQRQLLAEGWMHNRARMLTASFLTKDLHIDWRWGEEHFAQHLMDYDMASNVGGWQWAASTGTDPQPWFRIFNPLLQSRKFDPAGEYIRRWVPELKVIKGDAIHEPWHGPRPGDYPGPMVDHRDARKAALAIFRGADED